MCKVIALNVKVTLCLKLICDIKIHEKNLCDSASGSFTVFPRLE